MQIIPAVDVLAGSVVRLLHGRYDKVTTYAADPVEVAEGWTADGATLVHVVDLAGARTGQPDFDLWTDLGRSDIAFQIGGGIRDAGLAVRALEAGAQRVVVGTAAVHNPPVLGEIVSAVGGEHLVAAIDVRGDMAQGSGWTDEGVPLDVVVNRVVDAGVQTALVTGIERDGALTGPDVTLLARVTSAAPGLHMIASGGIGSLADIATVAVLSCDAVIIGRALYENRFTLGKSILVASRVARPPG
jgi:phosphoribosylformimino-5-aminoimidazole carboxamide ribotide isomerase